MGTIKDIVDLVVQLNDRVEDRKIAGELRQIQQMVGKLQSEDAKLHEKNIELLRENQQLTEKLSLIQKKVSAINSASTKDIDGYIEFKNKSEQSEYFKKQLKSSDFIEDFTWAKVTHRTTRNNSEPNYLPVIQEAAEETTEYYEIFIFSHAQRFRQDRLLKLKKHYERCLEGGCYNYSCAHYEESNFPRLQFTILNGSEIMFTSAHNTRCALSNQKLAKVFSLYFEDAWDDAEKLIEKGRIVNKAKIEDLLKNIDND